MFDHIVACRLPLLFHAVLNSQAFGATMGVLIGFVLNMWYENYKKNHKKKNVKQKIEAEMRFNQSAIPSRLRALRDDIENLNKGKGVNPKTISFLTTSFDSGFTEILDILESDFIGVIHCAYDLMKGCDSDQQKMEVDLLNALRDRVMKDPFQTYKNRIDEIIALHECIDKLIASYFEGRPIDVLNKECFESK